MTENTFEQKIVLIAKTKFKTQKALAEALSLKPSTIGDWVSGKAKPSFEVLKELCIKADISLDWLVLNKDMQSAIDHREFARIIVYANDWAREHKVSINDSWLASVYLTFETRRKEQPTLKIQDFLKEFAELYKNIKFN